MSFFQFVLHCLVVIHLFVVVDILPLPSFIHLTGNILCNPWFSFFFLSTLPSTSLIIPNTHFLILFYSNFKFLFLHSNSLTFSSRIFWTFCWASYNFSEFHLGFRFGNFTIFFNLISSFQPVSSGQSQYLLQSVCVNINHNISESFFHRYEYRTNSCRFWSPGAFHVKNILNFIGIPRR